MWNKLTSLIWGRVARIARVTIYIRAGSINIYTLFRPIYVIHFMFYSIPQNWHEIHWPRRNVEIYQVKGIVNAFIYSAKYCMLSLLIVAANLKSAPVWFQLLGFPTRWWYILNYWRQLLLFKFSCQAHNYICFIAWASFDSEENSNDLEIGSVFVAFCCHIYCQRISG